MFFMILRFSNFVLTEQGHELQFSLLCKRVLAFHLTAVVIYNYCVMFTGTSSLGLSVEMTAYSVLSLVKLGGEENLISAFQAVRWISKHRNAEGGFVSTQALIK